MVPCPKCGFSVAESAAECPACGVILAKVRAAPPPIPASPYAPPAAAYREPVPPEPVAAPPLPETAGMGGEISAKTLEALTALRPWLRFLVVYGFVLLVIMALAAVGSLFAAFRSPQMFPLAMVYGFYAAIGLAFLLPLQRSAEAIRQLPERGPRATVEAFAVEQGAFWRRTGLLTAVMLCLALLGVVLALLFGGLAALNR